MDNELLNLLRHFDVISFDVFDTLLLRPYLKPTDLFCKVAGETFRQERIAAEWSARAEARAAGREEVTYDEIYEKLPRWYDIKSRELEEERCCLTANPEVVEIFQAAKAAGKKVVIASDMYLPRDFLESVLREKGIDGWDGFYLSCDCGVQKCSGKMFSLIADEMGGKPYRILHIGDDVEADVRQPERVGVGTWRVPKVREVFFEENSYARQFVEKHAEDSCVGDFVGSLIVAWQLERCRKDYSSWQKMACLFGGPVVFAFVKWMIQDARTRGITRLLFVARDGYTPKRLVELLAPELRTDYIYAPRAVSKLIQLGAKVPDDYVAYIRKLEIDSRTSAIVDGNTERFSSQRLVNACLPGPCMGYYFLRTAKGERCASYYFLTNTTGFEPYMFLESLYCAPTMPIESVVGGSPVYFSCPTPYEAIRAANYQLVSDAIVRAAAYFERIGSSVDPKVLLEWLDEFTQNMTLADEISLAHVKNALDVAHEHYQSVSFRRRRRPGWKWIGCLPIYVASYGLEGYVLVLRIRILGIMPIVLRFRVAHEPCESWLCGDALKVFLIKALRRRLEA